MGFLIFTAFLGVFMILFLTPLGYSSYSTQKDKSESFFIIGLVLLFGSLLIGMSAF